MIRAALVIAGAVSVLGCSARGDNSRRTFELSSPAEVRLSVQARCAQCDWGAARREAVAFRLSVDGRYSQHVVLTVGGGRDADYANRFTLGELQPGRHEIVLDRDAALSAPDAGPAAIVDLRVEPIGAEDAQHTVQSLAPILYARPNTVGKFTDLPLVMWCEVVETPRGRQYRYSVIFSNEDGGTPTDRLMATWGRTTDIEYVYGVELDPQGRVLAEQFQGPRHEVPAFKGRHEARHPLLWVSTDNNMVSESGPTDIRYAPAPEQVDLSNRSREAVMDANPWLYAVMARELVRENKIIPDAPPGHGTIPDPRQFVYVEACGVVGTAALAFDIGFRDSWITSDREVPQYRIVRDGCFRSATPLPAGTTRDEIQGIRVQAYRRPSSGASPPPPSGPVTLTRINKVFMLDDRFVPGQSVLQWTGTATIQPGGPAFEVPFDRSAKASRSDRR